MTAPARLLALHLHGFKSFRERTMVEFGPGISAVVGPNGAGKSNLADALRWALGEQGRALRLRKSEDVIFAGSEKRSALGMADVTLVFGNSDRLLPIDYETVELGRRLFRSGENDYLLNRQRVRLKDLVDLLDSAHLADNAFLFIGQGTVDQALALRPEERRPLFEEVAGVRRHERRKAKAEDQLAEAEANLARIEDLLAELRPQARRLASQAEQQASRQTAGREYGRAVIALARSRWSEVAGRARDAAGQLATGRAQIAAAMAELREGEEAAAAVARVLALGSEFEADRRAAHEAARGLLTELQLRDARAASDVAGAGRERERLERDLVAAEANLVVQRREQASPVPARDLALAAAVVEGERALAEALEQLSSMRAAQQAQGEAPAALRLVEAARAAELETARRRLADAERGAADERAAADDVARRLEAAETACRIPRAALSKAIDDERTSVASREAARAELDRREGARQAAAEKASALASRLAGLGGRLEGLQARLAEEATRGISRAARRAGGRPLSDGLEVEAGFRVAVQAALGEAMRGYVIGREAALGLDGQRGVLVLEGAEVREVRRGAAWRDRDAEAEAVAEAAAGCGGGRLAEVIRVDPVGAAGRLLARSVWVPDLSAALTIQPKLPAGWLAVTLSGAAVTSFGVVELGRDESLLERRAEVERLAEEVARLEVESGIAGAEAAAANEAAAAARLARDGVREAERRTGAARREAEEAERQAARVLETIAREAAWRSAQAARLEADRDRLMESVRQSTVVAAAVAEGAETKDAVAATAGPDDERASALREWEFRAASLRIRRDQLAAEEASLEAVRHDAEVRRARASAAASLDQERIAGLERERADLAKREQLIEAERESLGEELAAAGIRDAALRAELDELHIAAAAGRARLTQFEAAAVHSRDRLRACQERVRTAEVAEMESRLALDAIREQVLVELAGLGDLGVRLLLDESGRGDGHETFKALLTVEREGGVDAADRPGDADSDPSSAATLERLLANATTRWARSPIVEPPGAAKLGALRRRFHELGAPNPFAAEEYADIKTRLDGLEAQRSDLTEAISKTRALIEQLNVMIATQFRSTFKALETAFDGRFRQLFGGGFARLSLTEPEDLAATGIEIVARPPGKKAQPLSMLSGGERALTAVALLFAMLEVHPVPFCVLDEVDAALDEANVGRFADALRGLADQTQFIVITHNRGTIESADALYGVTVGDDAVSRVISLRLEEAREIADQATRNKAAASAG
ncbi:MAG TPA: chromosome segregation protein SMC [Candidatus Limnocylindrales bacterium]|jgi:chromosome segregation protein